MSATVRFKGGTLGQQLPALGDLATQISNLLTDPSAGGIPDRLAQADAVIGQVEDELERLKGAKASLEAHFNLLTTLLQTLTGALGTPGAAAIEFSGDSLADVLAEVDRRKAELGISGRVYGVMMLASTGEADRALSALIGTGRTMRL